MKKIYLIGLVFLTLFSCNKTKVTFDSDFSPIVSNLKNNDYAFNTLIESDDSEYVFKMQNVPLKIRAYYKEYKDQFRYIFVMNFDYQNVEVSNIRIAALCLNKKNSIVAQVGFLNDKKTIASYEDKQDDKYLGIQLFLSPYIINESVIRFYFEYDNNVGSFYQFENLKEFVQ